jgi:hypothetical protein
MRRGSSRECLRLRLKAFALRSFFPFPDSPCWA